MKLTDSIDNPSDKLLNAIKKRLLSKFQDIKPTTINQYYILDDTELITWINLYQRIREELFDVVSIVDNYDFWSEWMRQYIKDRCKGQTIIDIGKD